MEVGGQKERLREREKERKKKYFNNQFVSKKNTNSPPYLLSEANLSAPQNPECNLYRTRGPETKIPNIPNTQSPVFVSKSYPKPSIEEAIHRIASKFVCFANHHVCSPRPTRNHPSSPVPLKSHRHPHSLLLRLPVFRL